MLCALTKICLSSIVHVNFTKGICDAEVASASPAHLTGNPSKVVDAHLKLVNWILMKTSQSEVSNSITCFGIAFVFRSYSRKL